MTHIIAIDTSCDDTSVAISEDRKIIANVFWSKLKVHSDWGGVVPSEAKRQHAEFLNPAIEEAFKQANLTINDIDYIAVTYGPGLAIALEAGIDKAKELATKYNKKIIAVNHMIGHIYANLALDIEGKPLSSIKNDFEFPSLALTISGGHTDLYIMNGHLQFTHIGQTIDDAIGESFDKVGRMLGMGFPAGAKIEKAAELGDPDAYKFPTPMSQTDDFNWSYSGLKTAVLYEIHKQIGDYSTKPQKNTFKLEDASKFLTAQTINDIAASFQKAATKALTIKLQKAIKHYKPKAFIVGGGVIANQYVRSQIQKICDENHIPLSFPEPMWLCTDNAAMIAIAAHFYADNQNFVKDLKTLDRIPNLHI